MTKTIEDGIEKRTETATLTTREGGMAALLRALQGDGFMSAARPRIARLGGELLLQFDLNVGDLGDVKYLGLQLSFPLRPDDIPEEEMDHEKEDGAGQAQGEEQQAQGEEQQA